MKERTKVFLEILLIVVFFIGTSYLVQNNLSYFEENLDTGVIGILVYILFVIIAEVIAPVSALPLIPIAVGLWGVFWSAIFNIIGWTIGGVIAFIIARRYGVPLIKKFVSLKTVHKFESYIPQENVFWSVVFLRMAIPVDILSYGLGLFSKINLKRFFWATLIGVTPFAFVLSYIGKVNVVYQIVAFIAGTSILLLGFLIYETYKKRKRNY